MRSGASKYLTAHLSSMHLTILHSDSPRHLFGLDVCNYAPPPTIFIKITTHRSSSHWYILLVGFSEVGKICEVGKNSEVVVHPVCLGSGYTYQITHKYD